MKTLTKVLIEIGIGICLIFIGVSMNGLEELPKSNIIQFNGIEKDHHRINDLQFHNHEAVDEIEVNIHQANVHFYERDCSDHKIEVRASDIYNGFEVYQKNGKLVIEQPYYWKNHRNQEAKIDIYVPVGYNLKKVEVNLGAGDSYVSGIKTHQLDINSGAGRLVMQNIDCYNFDLDAGLGQTEIQYINVQNRTDIDLGLGNVDIKYIGKQDDFNYNINVGLGSVRVGNHHFSGIADETMNYGWTHKVIDVDCGLGSVNIEMEE